MPDQTITCRDCGLEFAHTEKDQAFYASKVDERTGRPWNPPSRCRPCRQQRKSQAGGGGSWGK